ncbi:histidine kinase [Gloeocapsa sp. PCC 7428]|uniref:hybrid histidine kinase/response regulator HrmK n=1 Tax=Gloeocapsa sp. PCC 7428 TaxID=1173026 RepID=UPI0002A61204|nr:hybrid histidine kinase/response regulator HrmK [Gloeocapsa sp. PCC 7428]AFZ32582.1 histidine kinase [Gloeocapsa sp. PCC 7428]
MQQSSTPEEIRVDATHPEQKVANTEVLQFQQVIADLWLERGLNELQNQINQCLAGAYHTQQSLQELEAEVFQALIQQLSVSLKTDKVAIAFLQGWSSLVVSDAIPKHISRTESNYVVCYSALSTSAASTEKSPAWQLQQIISHQELQALQNQNPKAAWALQDDRKVVGWLIIATCALPKSATGERLKFQLQPQFIERSLNVTMHAIAQLKHLQALTLKCQQLEVQNCDLLRTNKLKSEFLANTSHEIRTPLSSILGFTHLLKAQGYNPENHRHQEYLNIILTSGQHLLALLNDILDLSKIEANQLEINKETVNIPEVCRSAISLVKEKASDKNLQLQLDIDANATTLVADSLRLKQMLFNLLSNALKFTNKGAVGLQVKQKGVFIHFTVWDTGTGIAKEKQPQLFQAYVQISNVVAGRQEGTGLGLALTQKLAQLHGGWVEVQSEVNCGSQFTIVLPLTTAAATSKTKVVPQRSSVTTDVRLSLNSQAAAPKTVTVMLVEDNFHNAKLMTTYLRKLGYQVTWVNSAAQMWEELPKAKPAVILMDVHLPDVDGLTLVQQLQANAEYRHIPVIVQTAMAMKGDRETCLAAGAIDYISKPIDLQALANMVSKYSDLNH